MAAEEDSGIGQAFWQQIESDAMSARLPGSHARQWKAIETSLVRHFSVPGQTEAQVDRQVDTAIGRLKRGRPGRQGL